MSGILRHLAVIAAPDSTIGREAFGAGIDFGSRLGDWIRAVSPGSADHGGSRRREG